MGWVQSKGRSWHVQCSKMDERPQPRNAVFQVTQPASGQGNKLEGLVQALL